MIPFFGILLAAAEVFDVASVKPAGPDARGIVMQFTPGGGLRAVNANLKQLLSLTYDIDRAQISGGPSWIDNERFDILAKGAAENASPAEEQRLARVRMQALLADRFQLKFRREQKDGQVYTLTVARNGHKLKPATDGFEGLSGRPGHIDAQRVNLAGLAKYLQGQLGRPVIDDSGITGEYAFQLDWAPDAAGPLASEKAGAIGATAADPTAPSLVQALQDQLGLRLQAKRGKVESLVIERVERPSPN